jgi:CHASE2 domain/TIR domain
VVSAEVASGEPVDPADFGDEGSWIDFRGPPETIPTYSFSDVVRGEVEPSDLEGRIVVVGASAPALQDLHPTSIGGGLMSGAEIQANATATVLDGLPLQPASAPVAFLLIVLMALGPPLATLRFSAQVVALAAVGALFAFLAVAQLAFNAGTVLPVVYPVLALLLSTVGAIVVELRTERHERETLQDTLGGLPVQASEFFISYRREQSAWPGRILCGELTKRFGESSVFMDTDSIDAGQQWPNQIENAIQRSSVVLVLIGPGWLDVRNAEGDRRLDDPGDWVRLEIEAALAAPKVVVVPVLLDGAKVPDAQDLPESLRPLAERNAVALTPDGWGREIDEMVESLRAGQLREHFANRDAVQGGARG